MPLVSKPFSDIITFTRASNATLFDSSGTLVYAPMNLLLQSEDFSTTWVTGRSNISPDVTIAPNDATTADAVIEDNTAANTHNVGQSFSFTAGVTYTISVFAKATASPRFLQIIFPSGAFGSTRRPVFDLVNGTAAPATDTTASIQNAGNGWYRCVASMQATATASASAQLQLADTYTNSNATYDGDGTSGIFIWGAQLNIANMQGGVTGDLSTYYPTTTAAYYGPRFDYNPATLAAQGLLIEGSRTNSIRNNTMQGAVAGTPGTLPTNWTISAGAGLSSEVVGTGTESGITYIDIRIFGTTAGAVNTDITFEAPANAAALTGQSWNQSSYLKLAGGTLTNVSSFIFRFNEYTSGSVFISGQNSSFLAVPTSSGLATQRVSASVTLNGGATTAQLLAFLRIGTDTGAVNYTLRIGLPQLELGAFATSVIPTTTTALTRAADVASVNTLSPWYNASEGTIYAEASVPVPAAYTGYVYLLGTFADGIMYFRQSDFQPVDRVRVSGADQFINGFGATWTTTAVFKNAQAYKANDFAGSVNGGAVATDSSGTVPSASVLQIGGLGSGSSPINGYLRRITYYPRRLSNAELQAITA